jgi:hypothetical protein
LAEFLARRLWWAMLWLMRRPAMRRLQRNSVKLLPESKREKAWQNIRRQEAWARDNGLPLLKVVITFLLISIGLTLTWLFVLELITRGLIPVLE